MASANLAVILSIISLLLLFSADARVPNNADDESAAVALPLEGYAPKDDEPTDLLIPVVDKTKVDLPALVDGFAHVDLSLVRPLHRHRPHCHHGYRLGGREVVHYGDGMISAPKHGEWSSFSNAATDVVVPEEVKRDMVNKEEDGGWRIRKEHKKKKKRTEDEDSDSDSDSDDEGIEMGKKELRKRKKEKGGWLKWFWGLWI